MNLLTDMQIIFPNNFFFIIYIDPCYKCWRCVIYCMTKSENTKYNVEFKIKYNSKKNSETAQNKQKSEYKQHKNSSLKNLHYYVYLHRGILLVLEIFHYNSIIFLFFFK